LDSGGWVNGMVLPVTIAASDEEVVTHVLLKPTADSVSLVSETAVCVVVILLGPIRTDDRCGADENFPGGVARLE
jgi:hypothetical protein